MIHVIRPRRFASVVLMLLSQVAGGLVVLCDEGVGGQVMEFLPRSCCETQVDDRSTSTSGDHGEDPCGPCDDIPLVTFTQHRDDFPRLVQLQAAAVATLADSFLIQLSRWGATPRDTTSPAEIPTTVSQLAGTVVLLC